MNLPALELLDELPGRGLLVRVAAGPLVGHVVAVITEPLPPPRPTPRPRVRLRTILDRNPGPAEIARSLQSERTAGELLTSLLNPRQLREWKARHLFWVDTPRGSVRLGRLYDLRHRPRPGVERSLCVVPVDHATLPVADIWVNLLLVLRTRPDEFFRVAIANPPRA